MSRTHDKRKDLIVALSAGIFIGVALFDALPESVDELGWSAALLWMGAGVLLWWLQKVILGKMEKPDTPVLVATALWLHSLIEGVATGLAFGVSREFGIAVLIGMILHLLPEFFAAVAAMQGTGAKRKTSIGVTLTGYVVLFAGFGITYWLLPRLGEIVPVLGAISGGAFAYVGLRIMRKRLRLSPVLTALAGVVLSYVYTMFV